MTWWTPAPFVPGSACADNNNTHQSSQDRGFSDHPPQAQPQYGQQLLNTAPAVCELTPTPNIRSDSGLIKTQTNIKAIMKEKRENAARNYLSIYYFRIR